MCAQLIQYAIYVYAKAMLMQCVPSWNMDS